MSTVIGSIFFIGILIFTGLCYNSFMFGEDIYLFFYKVSNLDFIIVFYLYLALTLYLLIKKYNLELLFLQLLFSITLLIAGEYTYSLFLQFIFLFIFFDTKIAFLKTIFLSIYLLVLHQALLLLFASSYILYFIALLLLTYTLFTNRELFKNFKHEKVLTSVVTTAFISAYFIFQNFIFDFYIWLDITDIPNYHSIEVTYLLSLVQFLIFIAIIYPSKNK